MIANTAPRGFIRPSAQKLALLVAITLLCSFSPVTPPSDERFTITILHTNDLHGHLLPFAYTEIGRSREEQPSVGGAARRATLVRELRRQLHNPSMLVDAGDVFTRGPLTNAYEGIADIEAMNSVGYELAAIGNNEFKAKDGVEENDSAGAQAALLQVVKRSRFPWICANARDEKGAFIEGVQPYVVREFNGVRVGFLGLTAPRSAGYPQTRGWKITNPLDAAREWIPKARAHCDILIAVTHLGVGLDSVIATHTSGIDAIVGGDSHTFLYKAIELENRDGAMVPIVQTGEFGVNLGRFDLSFRKTGDRWKLEEYRYELMPVGPKLAEARDVVETLRPYVRPFEVEVGRLDPKLIGTIPALRTRNTTQLIVDAIRGETGADLAINPEGGGFFEVFRHPTVTRYDIYSIMPFKNRVVTAMMTGSEIADLMKNDPSAILSGYSGSLDPAKSYNVALVDFIAGYYRIPEEKLHQTGRDLRDVVMEYLRGK
jgi:5'-nucleotidase